MISENGVLARAARVRTVSQRIKEALDALGMHVPIAVLPIYVDVESLHKAPPPALTVVRPSVKPLGVLSVVTLTTPCTVMRMGVVDVWSNVGACTDVLDPVAVA